MTEIAEEILTIISACLTLAVIFSAIIICLIVDYKRTLEIKEFNKTLTTEQKALIQDYENARRVNIFKKNKTKNK